MNDFHKPPINRDEPRDYIDRVHRLEKDKKEQTSKYQAVAEKNIGFMLVNLIFFIRKAFFFLFPFAKSTTRSDIAALDKQYITEQLLIFKQILLLLAREDQGENLKYIQDFSKIWQKLNEVCNNDYMAKQFPSQALKLKLLIRQILNYPPHEDHSLGSYLFKDVGMDWAPFPFLEILKKLHHNYQKDPRLSELSVWLSFLNEIIKEIEEK